ncbi:MULTISPECIES: hypothetical protein [Thermoanaerobacterium]|uniref:Uncharacterized protein n=3 Tax=Thermoanaerobacterium TaxID=28895 RepID=L0IQE2_THETR|nr:MULTISPECIES: hypothetical protein [Thermoanaerobacterium]AFK94256.1 hypothetical protein Tsac_2709 [Thermoanaerobacterium saccharolyticum JW/SL-YS485]AGB20431.1 hypothetical protein Thethe_02884 [Thermoanaerobacterium thermosaccharolyticum M0795]ETO39168.1 hypothetical protein V518_0756 [Thermoanaerobacterium aotearoense SCUT27]
MKKIREIEEKKRTSYTPTFFYVIYILLIYAPLIFFVKFIGVLGIILSYVLSFAILGYIYFEMLYAFSHFLYSFKLSSVLLTETIDVVVFLVMLFVGIFLYFFVHGLGLMKAMDFFFPFLNFPDSFDTYKNRRHNIKAYKTRYQRVLEIPLARFTKDKFNDVDFSIDGDHIISGNLIAMKFKDDEIRLTLENFGCYRDIVVYKKYIDKVQYTKLLQSSDFITYPVDVKCKTKDNTITSINLNFTLDWSKHPYDPEIRLTNIVDARQITKIKL